MRFTYVDSRGREIEVDSVEALALRIELGAIGPETRLYDAVADRWAPANEHPVYRSLASGEPADAHLDGPEGERDGSPERSEGGGGEPGEAAGEEKPSPEPEDAGGDDPLGLGVELTVTDDPEPDPREDEGDAWAGSKDVESPDGAVPADSTEGIGESFPLDGPEARGAQEDEALEAYEGTEEVETDEGDDVEVDEVDDGDDLPPWVADGEALWRGEAPADDVLRPDDEDDPGDPAAQPVDESPPPERPDRARSSAVEAQHAESAADGEDPDADLEPVPPETRTRGPRPRKRRLRRRWVRRSDRRRRRLRAVALVLVGLGVVGGAAYVLEAGPWSTPGEESTLPILSPEQRAVATETSSSAYADVLAVVEEELRGRPLPERPPEEWLSGVYLSSASRFPEVRTYWRELRDAVESVRRREEGLFRIQLDERIGALRGEWVDPSEEVLIDRIRDEAVRAYEMSASRRDSAYGGVVEVATAGLELHALLVEREEDIAYEPYSDPGVSRDPVLEAVPNDSLLRVEMNARLDQFLEAIDRYEIPRPITTAGLVGHVLATLQGIGVPDPPPEAPDSATPTADAARPSFGEISRSALRNRGCRPSRGRSRRGPPSRPGAPGGSSSLRPA